MTLEERAIQVLERANPMPALSTDRTRQVASAYLTAIQSRSSEMQTIERPETESHQSGPGKGKWLVAAIIMAVLATVGIVMATMNEEQPVATTPEVEEPEPVPSTTPEAQEEPAPEETVPETTPATDPEVASLSGLPVFAGQPPAGDYEAVGKDVRFVFTSDGSWKDCNHATCDLGEGVEIKPQELLSVFGWFEPLSMTVEEFHGLFSGTDELVVGDIEPLSSTHPDSTWTGSRFVVDVQPTAGRDSTCESGGLDGPPYPCVVANGFDRFWKHEDDPNDALGLGIHGPTQFHVLTREDGTSIWAAAVWFPYPRAPDGEYESLIERMQTLVQTIRFVD